mgnify:CR=1 FL=1|tara:strand:+ start:17197 stop:18195 length:999 start_codon:yes stop_codon:yes gene_type:complete
MKYGKDDYLVVEVNNKKYFGMAFAKGKLISEDGLEADDMPTIEFKSGEILANLGKDPKRGNKVFGVDIERYENDLQVGWPIKLNVWRTIEKREKKIVVKAFGQAIDILKQNNADGWTAYLRYLQLKPNKGKMQGFYKTKSSKTERGLDQLCISALDLTNSKELVQLILHEASHGIWARQVPRDIKAQWSSMFNKRNEIQRTEHEELEELARIISEFCRNGMSFKEVLKELSSESPEEHDAFRDAIAYVKKVHHIDKEEFEALAIAKPDKFANLWPIVTDSPQFKPDVTEYAMTNVKEFFAESMSYFLTDRKLPKDVTKGCKATLKNLVRHYE